jgi:hypothetical protein
MTTLVLTSNNGNFHMKTIVPLLNNYLKNYLCMNTCNNYYKYSYI